MSNILEIPDHPFHDVNIHGYNPHGPIFAESWPAKLKRPKQTDAPTCPYCGTRMDVLISGNKCPDVQNCGYHSHADMVYP